MQIIYIFYKTIKKMKYSVREIKDLIIAGFAISLAFAILLSGGYSIFANFNLGIVSVFVISFFTAGIGFLLHELMHKYVAQNYGLRAEFIAFYPMLFLAIIFSFFGFIFAAPGAVYIFGHLNKEKNGKISLAGPVTNIVLAALFLILIIVFGDNANTKVFLGFGLSINSLLAAFNMIPTMPFDGAKIYLWNKTTYFITLITSLLLFILSFVY
jgi:Zn-dependent protease